MIPAALRLPDDALLRNPSAGSPSGTNRKTSIDMHQQQKHNGASRQTVDARFLRWVQTVNSTLIVSEFGLHDGNYELITCTLEIDPELAAGTIIREFWDSLHLAPIQQIH